MFRLLPKVKISFGVYLIQNQSSIMKLGVAIVRGNPYPVDGSGSLHIADLKYWLHRIIFESNYTNQFNMRAKTGSIASTTETFSF